MVKFYGEKNYGMSLTFPQKLKNKRKHLDWKCISRREEGI